MAGGPRSSSGLEPAEPPLHQRCHHGPGQEWRQRVASGRCALGNRPGLDLQCSLQRSATMLAGCVCVCVSV